MSFNPASAGKQNFDLVTLGFIQGQVTLRHDILLGANSGQMH